MAATVLKGSAVDGFLPEGTYRIERIFLMVALLIFGGLQVILADYVVDDTFIHLTFARNLASGHGFAFNPDQPTNGITAPLWTFVLALFSLLLEPGAGLAKSLSILSGALTIPALYRLMKRLGLRGLVAGVGLLAWSANVWLARWSASGMEASFATLLLILAFDAHLSRKPIRAGLLLGLATLTRPEAAGLILVFAIDAKLEGNYRAAWQNLLFGVIPILLWCGYALSTFGSIIPNPALIKSDAILPPMQDIILGVKRVTSILGGSNGLEILGVLLAGFLALKVPSVPARAKRIYWLLAIWACFPALTYLSRGVFVQSRYLLIGLPPLILGGLLAIQFLLKNWNENHTVRVLYSVLVVLLLQQFALTWRVTLPHIKAFQPTIEALTKMSATINREAPANALVAVGDVGIVGFLCNRRVLDLEGLVSSEIVPFRLGMTLDDFILSGRFFKAGSPDYIIDKSRDPKRLEQKWNSQIVAIYPIPGALVDSANENWYYTLYRIPRI